VTGREGSNQREGSKHTYMYVLRFDEVADWRLWYVLHCVLLDLV
jgi:hypothetical protein